MRQANETTEQFEARERKMKEATLTFGHGPRICLGRNLSRLEANKVIATLFKNYEVSSQWTCFVRALLTYDC